MEDLDQSPLVTSSADSPSRPQPAFQYQFVREPDDEDDEDEEDEDEDLEELEVLERKPAAPLLDLGRDPVPPAPRGPLPAAPPCAPEVPASELQDDDDDDEPPARPPPPPPAGVSPQAEPAWTAAPAAPAAPPSTPAAPKRRGSVDETLFALPAASEPVIHSSADKIMDLKEQPGDTASSGRADFPSVLLETAASLPSLSPLSAASFQEHEYLGNLPAVSPAERTLQETVNEASEGFLERAKNPFLDRDLTECSELEYSEMGSSLDGRPKAESTMLVESPGEDVIVKSREEEDLVSSPESPMVLTKPLNPEDKALAAEKAKDSLSDGRVAREVPSLLREEYADFQPFERVWGAAAGGAMESEQVHKKGFEQSSPDKDSESSHDDTSFPSTPEPAGDGSKAHVTCAPFSPATEHVPLIEDQTSENKTDEKKIEERKAQIVTEKTSARASDPFLAADYVTTDALSEVTSMPEGLTPDLVQEACGSDLSEATGAKIAHETKMDLVQTSEAVQESLYPVAQLCPSFEDSEATPSPVLPDIVMEAPPSSLLPGTSAPVVQAPPSADHESVKLQPENPPPYEEAMNVSLKAVPGIKEDAKEPESMAALARETEAPYISIACDLIKETSPDFSNYSEIAKGEKPGADDAEPTEDSSPDSEPVDLFSDDSIPEVPQKPEEAVLLVKENLTELSEQNTKKQLNALPQEMGKPYLESFQPSFDITKGTLSSDGISTVPHKETIPLQMEEFNAAVYSNDNLLSSKEAKIKESDTFSDSSPIEIIDEFPTFVSSISDSSPKLTRESTDLEVSHKSEIADVQSTVCSELSHDLSFKSTQPEDEVHVLDEFSKARSDASKVSLVPANVSAWAAETEMGSIVKPKVPMKEAEKKLPSDTEQVDGALSALFSAELSKTSVVDLLYWRDIKKTGVVFGASLFLLLSLTVFSIVSVTAYIALALLSVTISFRIYKGVIQAIQKSDEGHPFRAYLESDVAISEELVQKYSNSALGHVNCTIKELRRLFLVDDLVDSLKFALLMWVFTYVGALFNGLTLLILALISLFSVPVIYERHQAQIDHYVGLAHKNVKDALAKIQAKIPGLKRKAE